MRKFLKILNLLPVATLATNSVETAATFLVNITQTNSDDEQESEYVDVNLPLNKDDFLIVTSHDENQQEVKKWNVTTINLGQLRKEKVIDLDAGRSFIVSNPDARNKNNYFKWNFRDYLYDGSVPANWKFEDAYFSAQRIFLKKYANTKDKSYGLVEARVKFHWYYNDNDELLIDIIRSVFIFKSAPKLKATINVKFFLDSTLHIYYCKFMTNKLLAEAKQQDKIPKSKMLIKNSTIAELQKLVTKVNLAPMSLNKRKYSFNVKSPLNKDDYFLAAKIKPGDKKIKKWNYITINLGRIRKEQIIDIRHIEKLEKREGKNAFKASEEEGKISYKIPNLLSYKISPYDKWNFRDYLYDGPVAANWKFEDAYSLANPIFSNKLIESSKRKTCQPVDAKVKFHWYYNDNDELLVDVVGSVALVSKSSKINPNIIISLGSDFCVYYCDLPIIKEPNNSKTRSLVKDDQKMQTLSPIDLAAIKEKCWYLDLKFKPTASNLLTTKIPQKQEKIKKWALTTINLKQLRKEQIIDLTPGRKSFIKSNIHSVSGRQIVWNFRDYLYDGPVAENWKFEDAYSLANPIFFDKYYDKNKNFIKMEARVKFHWYYNDNDELLVDIIRLVSISLQPSRLGKMPVKHLFYLAPNFGVSYRDLSEIKDLNSSDHISVKVKSLAK